MKTQKIVSFLFVLYVISSSGQEINEESIAFINYTTTKDSLTTKNHSTDQSRKGSLWLGVGHDLICLGKCKQNTKLIPVFLKKPLINDSIIENKNILLPYNQNNIRFYFSKISLQCNCKTNYKYRLKGYNDEWSYTKNKNIQFTSLPSGNYTFQVFSANQDGFWSRLPSEQQIVIEKHYTEKFWFKLSVIFIFILLTCLVIFIAVKRNHIKLKRDISVNKIKEQALTASMNPHFIFNTLNSIQDFINKNNLKDANEYLVKFSRLIRANLDSIKSNSTDLLDEFNRIKLYLSLEKLRFDNKLNYSLFIDSELSHKKIILPSMIIQPFVENAILHGILPKKEGGNVRVSAIKTSSKEYEIRIEDDGVGINKTIVKHKHNSISINFTLERIQLLSKISNQTFDFTITNRIKTEGTSGTIVKFVLPISYK